LSRISRLIEEVFELVSIELYGVIGVASGDKLVVSALREGSQNVYSFDGDNLVRLNKEPFNLVTVVPPGAKRVVIGRDTTRGREQHVLLYIDVDEPGVERRVSQEQEPMRIFGLAYDDRRVAFTGSTARDIGLYLAEWDGPTRKVATLPGIGAVMSLKGDIAAGIGLFQGEPERFQLFIVDLEKGETKIHGHPEGSVTWATFSSEGRLVYGLEGAERAKLMSLDPATLKAEPLELPYRDLDSYSPRAFNYIGYTPEGELIVVARKNGRGAVFIDGRRIETPEGMVSRAFKWRGRIVAGYSSLSTPHSIIEAGDPQRLVVKGETPKWLSDAIGESRF
jgi:hypothetical protein